MLPEALVNNGDTNLTDAPETNMVAAESPGSIIEFGTDEPHKIRYDEFNIVGQYRLKRDPQRTQDLKESIASIGLINKLTVMETDPKTASVYLSFTNEKWGKQIDFSDLVPNSNGNYYIILAGHGRYIVIGQILDDLGITYDHAFIGAEVEDCILSDTASIQQRRQIIYSALQKQVPENIIDPVAEVNEAAAIREMFNLGQELGLYKSIADFVKDSPVGRRKTYNAIRFFELPIAVQDMVVEEHISYSQALSLYHLMGAYQEYYQVSDRGLSANDISRLVEGQLLNVAELAITEGWTVEKTQKYVKSLIRDLSSGIVELSLIQLSAEEFVAAQLKEIDDIRRMRIKKLGIEAVSRFTVLLKSVRRGEILVMPNELTGALDGLSQTLGELAISYTGLPLGELLSNRQDEVDALLGQLNLL